MRGNDFLDKMELIDPAYVEAADGKTQSRKYSRVKWGTIAACLCLATIGTLTLRQQNNSRQEVPLQQSIPQQSISQQDTPQSVPQDSDFTNADTTTIPELNYGGMGFEGYMCHDISELHNSNPWTENMNISTLPVYQNNSYDPTGAGVPKGLSREEMLELLSVAASALHLEVLSTEIIADGMMTKDGESVPDPTPTRVHAETDNGTINIYADGEIEYYLPGEGLELPKGYSFTRSDTTDEEAERVLSYLMDVYNELLAFTEPRAVTSGDYNIYDHFNRLYKVYDASGDDLEDILNYHFCYANFYPGVNGNLYLIRIYNSLLTAEKLGDYPVITVEEATNRLLAGNYQTSVPEAFPGKEFIGKVELMYRTGPLTEVLLPYYRFYVLLPDTTNSTSADYGLKTYGAYYVPAIAD